MLHRSAQAPGSPQAPAEQGPDSLHTLSALISSLGSSLVVPSDNMTWKVPGKSETFAFARCRVLLSVPCLSCLVDLTFTLCRCESCQPVVPQCAKAHEDPSISNLPLSFPPSLFPSFPPSLLPSPFAGCASPRWLPAGSHHPSQALLALSYFCVSA